jgi:hypothetical protein
VEVAYAPVLPYLKVPERKPGVWAPFKPPTGFEVKDPTKVKRLGGLIRKRGPVAVTGGFKSPTISPSLLVPALPTPPPADAPPAPPVQSAPPPPPPANDPAIVPLVLWSPKPPGVGDDGSETPGEPGPPVSVDPVLCKFLREHQREGVQVRGAEGGREEGRAQPCDGRRVHPDRVSPAHALNDLTLTHSLARLAVHV